jgi:hypothetical protein
LKNLKSVNDLINYVKEKETKWIFLNMQHLKK